MARFVLPASDKIETLPMWTPLAQMAVTWYLFPLALVISLVYSASRYELPERILRRAGRLFITIMVFMFVFFVILFLLSRRL